MLALTDKQVKRIKWRLAGGTVHLPSGCISWAGRKNADGYGLIYVNGKERRAHRLSYQILKSEPGNFCVCHTCDDRACVNPEHLFLGTVQENNADMVTKGRGARGASHGRTKILPEMRELAVGLGLKIGQRNAAKFFGVSQRAIFHWTKIFKNKGEV